MGYQQESEEERFVPKLDGLNERLRQSNPSPGEFDSLLGFIHQRSGILERPPGTKLLANIAGKRILSIRQTLDTRQNVLVQTDNGVYLYSENELFGRTIPTSLTPVTISEEEDMAEALLMQAMAANNTGGSSTAATFVQTTLNSLVYQKNPDGTNATFVTALVANVFTLAAGSYRFAGWRRGAGAAANVRIIARLYNVSAGAAAFLAADNENSDWEETTAADRNVKVSFGGQLTIAGPTQFEIQQRNTTTYANKGFGAPYNLGGLKEIYGWLKILKTA